MYCLDKLWHTWTSVLVFGPKKLRNFDFFSVKLINCWKNSSNFWYLKIEKKKKPWLGLVLCKYPFLGGHAISDLIYLIFW
jgi:hypothetical protein